MQPMKILFVLFVLAALGLVLIALLRRGEGAQAGAIRSATQAATQSSP